MSDYFPYLIIGGGIAGITCAETLHHIDENLTIGLITCTDTVKSVTNLHRITKLIEDFDVSEKTYEEVSKCISKLTIIKGIVDYIDPIKKSVYIIDNREIFYDKLCICTGGEPKLIAYNNPLVVGIRDTESVEKFKGKLSGCKRVAIVGNGGIATELVYELRDCEILWIIKDKDISSHFFDPGASKFLLNTFSETPLEDKGAQKVNKQRHHYNVDGQCYITEKCEINKDLTKYGGSLGPDWALNRQLNGCGKKKLEILYEVEVVSVTSSDSSEFNASIVLTDGTTHHCDLVISATGVHPSFPRLSSPHEWLVSDMGGGIVVQQDMCTNIDHIYAAGDCCHAGWQWAEHWFQMRLWQQARAMAFQAAKSMSASLNQQPKPMLDFSFELFTHVTKFFGFSVILLGLYNGQKLELDGNAQAELLVRISPGKEYIKCVVVNGRIHGAMLIGDTELAETLEDLILDQIDVSPYGENLLDPNIDIVDYFD